MSRIGKQPIAIPSGVEVAMKDSHITVTGPRGELYYTHNSALTVSRDDGHLTVTRPTDRREHRSLHGLTRTLIANMVHGVSEGFTKSLTLVGVGYRAQMDSGKLVLQVGFSHRVEVSPPEGITLNVEGNDRIIVSGIDKQMVGQVAAKIRRIRRPDPYKGKGIRYTGEYIRLKPGKRAATGAG